MTTTQERKRLANNQTPIPGLDTKFAERDIELVKMEEQVFSPELFIPMETGKPIDLIFTEDGGVPKACNFMMIGDPGIGKSTVALDILSDLQLSDYKVLFISAEMTRIDLHGYVNRFPKFGSVDILFLNEYFDSNPKEVIEKALSPGYDIVLMDSFAEIQSTLKESLSMNANSAEKWITNAMLSNNSGVNKSHRNTTFIAIQQVTKDGVQLGTNRLKHAMTGMIELRKDEESGKPFIVFTKNRRGAVNKRMYYTLSTSGDVRYDIEKYMTDYAE